MNTKPIVDFIDARPALSIRALAKEAGLNPNQWYNFRAGHDKSLPDTYAWALACELARYGLEVDGWRFEYDAETGCLFLEKTIDLVETIEHENEAKTRSWFEYRVATSRDVLARPDDLAGFLEKC